MCVLETRAMSAQKEGECTANSCSGHGACLLPSYSHRNPVCLCEAGYADGVSGLCGSCAEGYLGYPDCRRETEAEERDSDAEAGGCTLPLLPRALQASGAIPLHVHGKYFLDQSRKRHVLAVGAEQPSLVRVQVDLRPSEVRVKLALEERVGNQQGAGSKAGEEVWKVLQEGDSQGSLAYLIKGMPKSGPLQYRLVLAYELVDFRNHASRDCSALSLQAGLYPQDNVKHIASLIGISCPAGSSPLDLPTTVDVPVAGTSDASI